MAQDGIASHAFRDRAGKYWLQTLRVLLGRHSTRARAAFPALCSALVSSSSSIGNSATEWSDAAELRLGVSKQEAMRTRRPEGSLGAYIAADS